MVYCKGCKKNISGLLFTGFNETCDICIDRVAKYRGDNLDKIREANAKYREKKS